MVGKRITTPAPLFGPAPFGGFGLRTACWLKALLPTRSLRVALKGLPRTRVLRHGDFVHVMYDVDSWAASSAITREDVVARVRSALFAAEIGNEVALGHFVGETDATTPDHEDIAHALGRS